MKKSNLLHDAPFDEERTQPDWYARLSLCQRRYTTQTFLDGNVCNYVHVV